MTPSPTRKATQIEAVVARHVPTDGTHETPIEGVRLFRVSAPVHRVPGVYEPSVCAVVAGAKHAYHGGRAHVYGPGHYLCTPMPTPVEAEVPHASVDAPVLGVLIDLDTRPMTELLIQHRATRPLSSDSPGATAGPAVAPWNDEFGGALLRLLELLDDTVAVQLLAPGRLRELCYAIVEGPVGPTIRDTLGAPTHQLAPVLTYMRNNLDQPLAVEDLAARAGMSRAAFDRHFKAVTSLSPLKYLKALRLNDAAMLIASGATIAHAANRVGYTSPSQFSREFKRHYGTTPRSWAGRAVAVDPPAFASY